MQGKVLPDHYDWNAIDWPNSQNHFVYGDQEPNQVIRPAFKFFLQSRHLLRCNICKQFLNRTRESNNKFKSLTLILPLAYYNKYQ